MEGPTPAGWPSTRQLTNCAPVLWLLKVTFAPWQNVVVDELDARAVDGDGGRRVGFRNLELEEALRDRAYGFDQQELGGGLPRRGQNGAVKKNGAWRIRFEPPVQAWRFVPAAVQGFVEAPEHRERRFAEEEVRRRPPVAGEALRQQARAAARRRAGEPAPQQVQVPGEPDEADDGLLFGGHELIEDQPYDADVLLAPREIKSLQTENQILRQAQETHNTHIRYLRSQIENLQNYNDKWKGFVEPFLRPTQTVFGLVPEFVALFIILHTKIITRDKNILELRNNILEGQAQRRAFQTVAEREAEQVKQMADQLDQQRADHLRSLEEQRADHLRSLEEQRGDHLRSLEEQRGDHVAEVRALRNEMQAKDLELQALRGKMTASGGTDVVGGGAAAPMASTGMGFSIFLCSSVVLVPYRRPVAPLYGILSFLWNANAIFQSSDSWSRGESALQSFLLNFHTTVFMWVFGFFPRSVSGSNSTLTAQVPLFAHRMLGKIPVIGDGITHIFRAGIRAGISSGKAPGWGLGGWKPVGSNWKDVAVGVLNPAQSQEDCNSAGRVGPAGQEAEAPASNP